MSLISFQPDTKILSAEVNANFEFVSDRITVLEALVDQDVKDGADPTFGTVTADEFVGDGSQLTGIAPGGAGVLESQVFS
jgi:hypothetical protein